MQCSLFNVALVLSGFVLAKSFISNLQQQRRRTRRTQLPMALINVFNFLSLQRVWLVRLRLMMALPHSTGWRTKIGRAQFSSFHLSWEIQQGIKIRSLEECGPLRYWLHIGSKIFQDTWILLRFYKDCCMFLQENPRVSKCFTKSSINP